jgi:zinc/manganese transport system substrate-binding protein
MKKQIIFMTLLFLIIAIGTGKAAKKLDVVTTLPSLASITENIGGDQVKVYSITRGVQDAHYVEAKPSYMLNLNKADLLIYSGLELEIGWLPLLIQGARNQKVVVGARGNLNASLALPEQGILEKPRGEVDRSMGDVHPAGNPHYLLNPHNGFKVAEFIADKLIELDPDHQSVYENNLETFKKALSEKIKQWETKAKVLNGLEVVCYHVHWSYLLDWLGIQQAGYIELRPGIPPTPRHKREIIELIKQHGIKLVIVSSWKDPKKSKEVADETGAELVILPGEVNAMDGSEDYFLWINYLVNQLIEKWNSHREKSD